MSKWLRLCNVTFRDRLLHIYWYCLCSHMTTCSLLDYQIICNAVTCTYISVCNVKNPTNDDHMKLQLWCPNQYDIRSPSLSEGEMCCKGCNIPDALRQSSCSLWWGCTWKKNCTENLYMEMVRLHHVTIRL